MVPAVFEMPTSGLKDQRLVPMFTSRLASYWLQGAGHAQARADRPPSCRHARNSVSASAGAP
jgi:hypothetical protein